MVGDYGIGSPFAQTNGINGHDNNNQVGRCTETKNATVPYGTCTFPLDNGFNGNDKILKATGRHGTVPVPTLFAYLELTYVDVRTKVGTYLGTSTGTTYQ